MPPPEIKKDRISFLKKRTSNFTQIEPDLINNDSD